MIWKSGDKYNGNWEHDLMNGYGKKEYSSGEIYEGEFKNNEFEGKGKYIFASGSYYGKNKI
jgi:hypothetical protein